MSETYCRFSKAEDESQKGLALTSPAIIEIRGNHLRKDVID